MKLTQELISRYAIEGPRYTSYPTVPSWGAGFTESSMRPAYDDFDTQNGSLSLYVHIPFCEKRCYYCACNVVIRKPKPEVADTYLDYLQKELSLISTQWTQKPTLAQLHIGGGTPTFLSRIQMTRLMTLINDFFQTDSMKEAAIEVDPRSVNAEDIFLLRELGFDRLSFGIQDFNRDVQEKINRLQTPDQVQELFDSARSVGFKSINCDLIYGLPDQTQDSLRETISAIGQLKPDRIAFYSFAYLPTMYQHQRLIKPEELPTASDKQQLFLFAREALLSEGYEAIAMDHFALKTDPLFDAFESGQLNRSFMGYTTDQTADYLGVGTSAIGFLGGRFYQNEKDLKVYYQFLDEEKLPIVRGHQLTDRDYLHRWVIIQIMCHFHLDKAEFESLFDNRFDVCFSERLSDLDSLASSGLLKNTSECIQVTELGKLFVRNICMVFDAYL